MQNDVDNKLHRRTRNFSQTSMMKSKYLIKMSKCISHLLCEYQNRKCTYVFTLFGHVCRMSLMTVHTQVEQIVEEVLSASLISFGCTKCGKQDYQIYITHTISGLYKYPNAYTFSDVSFYNC